LLFGVESGAVKAENAGDFSLLRQGCRDARRIAEI
jgi:hypothetical protein